MRKIGYTLLLVGFCWACFQELSGFLRLGIRQVALEQYETLSPDKSKLYTAEDVSKYIRETAVAAYGSFPHAIVPGILMLIGGLLYGRERRVRNDQTDA